MTANQAYYKVQEGIDSVLLDVREPRYFDLYFVYGSFNIPASVATKTDVADVSPSYITHLTYRYPTRSASTCMAPQMLKDWTTQSRWHLQSPNSVTLMCTL